MASDPKTGNQFTAIFKNGALEQLKQLATSLEIPEEKMGEVLTKGIKIIDLARGGKLIIEKNNERIEVDVKKV